MVKFKLSYLIFIATCVMVLLIIPHANAAKIYLDPDSVFITTGIGTEFNLDLNVDDETDSLRLFQVFINFDTSKVDTVSEPILGPLFDTSGYIKQFNYFIYYDSTLSTTILRLEALLMGPTAVVDGPGIVASINLVAKDTGFIDLSILQHVMTDIRNDTIPSTSEGAVAFVDYLPNSFELISPVAGTEISSVPGGIITFTWEESFSIYPAENVEYMFEISSTSNFLPESTTTCTGIAITNHTIQSNDLTFDNEYWWRVTAKGDLHGFERESSPFGQSFYLNPLSNPTEFNLLYPDEGQNIIAIPADEIAFYWNESTIEYIGETINYDFDYSLSPTFESGLTTSFTGLIDTTFVVNTNDMGSGQWYWRVKSYGILYGTETNSTPWPGTFSLSFEADPGEFDLLTPTHDSENEIWQVNEILFDWETSVSVLPNDTTWYTLYLGTESDFLPGEEIFSDVTEEVSQLNVLIDDLIYCDPIYWKVKAENSLGFYRWSTSTFSSIFYMRGDVTCDKSILVDDIVFLVNFLFKGGASPVIIASGNVDCEDEILVSDIVTLVDFLFKGGVIPDCGK